MEYRARRFCRVYVEKNFAILSTQGHLENDFLQHHILPYTLFILELARSQKSSSLKIFLFYRWENPEVVITPSVRHSVKIAFLRVLGGEVLWDVKICLTEGQGKECHRIGLGKGDLSKVQQHFLQECPEPLFAHRRWSSPKGKTWATLPQFKPCSTAASQDCGCWKVVGKECCASPHSTGFLQDKAGDWERERWSN